MVLAPASLKHEIKIELGLLRVALFSLGRDVADTVELVSLAKFPGLGLNGFYAGCIDGR